MSLVVEKLNKNNFDIYQTRIIKSLKEEYKKTYEVGINNNQIRVFCDYCISNMYVLVFKSYKPKLIGYFSLSRTDLNRSKNIVQYISNVLVGNVYLFDVYVYPKYRNKGIGIYLVSKAIQTAKQMFNANQVSLYTKSLQLSKFYKKNKFEYVKSVVIDNIKLLLFTRTIKT